MERRHSVPAVMFLGGGAAAELNRLQSARDTMEFYTPQASSLTHRQKLNAFKDLMNAPVKKERFRPSRRASVPDISITTSKKETVCKRLDFNESTSLKRNSYGCPKSSTAPTSSLDDVFSELRVEKHSKRVRFSDSPITPSKTLKSCLRHTSKYDKVNLGRTPPSVSLQRKTFETKQMSELRNIQTPPTSSLKRMFETPSSSTAVLKPSAKLKMNFETPSSIQLKQKHSYEHQKSQFQQLHERPFFNFRRSQAQKSLFELDYNSKNSKMHINSTNITTTTKRFSMKTSSLFGNPSSSLNSDSQNLLKKTLQSTKAAKELDLLLK